ncbi:MAG: hypothetical protein ACXWQO_20340 [Bdellovibrionota bacterium]
MKNIFIAVVVALLPLTAFSAESKASSSAPWNDFIESDQGKFAVSVLPAQKKIEIKKVGPTSGKAPYLRVRVLRPNDRPLELGLKAVERVNTPLFYTGQLKQWPDSYMGLEVDFSFDKKTWKRLGNTLMKVLP